MQKFWISTIFFDRGATVLFLRAIMRCHFFHLFSAIFAGPRVLNSRNFVTIATWRDDYPLLTVYKAHISKVYFVVVAFILHVFYFILFFSLSSFIHFLHFRQPYVAKEETKVTLCKSIARLGTSQSMVLRQVRSLR